MLQAAVNTQHGNIFSLCRSIWNSHSWLLALIIKEIKMLWNGVLGIRVYPELCILAHKHIQYSSLTRVSCVCVMDQYLLIRATLCAASLKRSDEPCVMIHVFSVNHASGARSQLTAPLNLNISGADRRPSRRRRHSDCSQGIKSRGFSKTPILIDGLQWRYNIIIPDHC